MSLATPHGLRLLKQAKLDLNSLLPDQARTVLDPGGRFPAIFRSQPFPFLLVPPDLLINFNLTARDYSAGLNQTGTIWYWESTKKGATQIHAPPIPGTPLVFAYDETADCLVLLKYSSDRIHLLIQNDDPVTGPIVRVIDSPPCKPKSTFRRFGLLYVLYNKEADIIDLTTGLALTRAKLPGSVSKIGDGYYRMFPSQIGFLGWNGQELAWEPICLAPAETHICQVFQREGLEGPWYLDADGTEKKGDSIESHAAALRYVDNQLPILMEALKRRATPTFFIICSDHGTAYGEDGFHGHRLNHPVVGTVPYAHGFL